MRGLAVVVAGIGLLGCTTHDNAPASQPTPPPPPDASVDPADVEDPRRDDGPAPLADAVQLVGVVHEGGSRVCEAETFEETWIRKYWQVGWTPLVSEPALDAKLATLPGRVVKVTGRAVDGPPTYHGPSEPPAKLGMCSQHQMRSDWRLTPEGIRIPRGHGPEFAAFEVTSVEVVRPLETAVPEDGEQVAVTVHNPFETDLRGVELIGHYEGCYGKPGATAKTVKVGKLAATDASGPHRLPTLIEDADKNPRGRNYALRSLELKAAAPRGPVADGAWLDLEVAASQLGLHLECP